MPGGTIQLLPETRRRVDIKIPGENRPVYFGLAFLVLVAIIFAGLKLYSGILTNNLKDLNTKALALEEKRDRVFEKELLILDQRFLSASGLISNHIVWSNALAKIQNLTPPQVRIEIFSADTQKSKIDLKGFASSYTVIAQFIASLLSEEAITDIELNKVNSLSIGLLEFDMKIVFNKNKFLLQKESSIEVKPQ